MKHKMNNTITAIVIFFMVISIVFISCDDGSGDRSDNKTTPSPTRLYLFSTSATYNGNLDGRDGADDKCGNDSNRPAEAETVHALISVSSADSVADMPVTYGFPSDVPIVGPDGETVIADDWADLLDNTIDITLFAAGVFGSGSSFWWSGSTGSGSADSSTCTGWTVSASGTGFCGSSGETGASWIWYDTDVCSATYYLLGIGY